MGLLEDILARGGIVWGLGKLSEGLGAVELGMEIERRFPGLSSDENRALSNEIFAAREAGKRIQDEFAEGVIPLGVYPTVPELAAGDYGGARTQIPVNISAFDENGNVIKTWLVVITGSGTESLDDIMSMALQEMRDRSGKSPSLFGEFDPDSNRFLFEILGAAKAF